MTLSDSARTTENCIFRGRQGRHLNTHLSSKSKLKEAVFYLPKCSNDTEQKHGKRTVRKRKNVDTIKNNVKKWTVKKTETTEKSVEYFKMRIWKNENRPITNILSMIYSDNKRRLIHHQPNRWCCHPAVR